MDFSRPWKNSDQILQVGEQQFHVHRCMLGLSSPVFERMFNGPFKEKDSCVIQLKGKDETQVGEMLNVLYDRSKAITGRWIIIQELAHVSIIQNHIIYQAKSTAASFQKPKNRWVDSPIVQAKS